MLQIFAYKDDLFIIDSICVGFRISDDGEWYFVQEESPVYSEVISIFSSRFGINEESWWSDVAFPAFDRNFTHLWGEEYDWDKHEG